MRLGLLFKTFFWATGIFDSKDGGDGGGRGGSSGGGDGCDWRYDDRHDGDDHHRHDGDGGHRSWDFSRLCRIDWEWDRDRDCGGDDGGGAGGGPGPDPDGHACPTGDPLGSEAVNGTIGDDVLAGVADYASTIAGNEGNDMITGGGYADFLLGNEGNDTLDGGCGDDTLHGGLGDDTVRGGHGNDQVFGDFGADDLWGGEGADTFCFIQRTIADGTHDTIHDFDPAQDMLDLGNIDPSLVSFQQDGADAGVYVNGSLEALVLGTDAADLASHVIYDSLV